MIAKLISLIGLKFLAKKIVRIFLERVAYPELRELVGQSENKVDDEIAEAVIEALDGAVEKF